MADYSTQDLCDNLNYLNETKEQIKQAIIDKEQPISDNDTFRSYADKIRNIETGIDTSDATAGPSDIISPKTAYVNGKKLTGTMSNNGAKIITPGDIQIAIPAGYHDGNGYVKAMDITTSAEYTECLDLSNQILGGA